MAASFCHSVCLLSRQTAPNCLSNEVSKNLMFQSWILLWRLSGESHWLSIQVQVYFEIHPAALASVAEVRVALATPMFACP